MVGHRLRSSSPATPFHPKITCDSGLCAPAVGLGCGVNLTGETKNPGRSIPAGMFWASFTGVLFFALMAAVISASVWKLYLLPEGAVVVAPSSWSLAGEHGCHCICPPPTSPAPLLLPPSFCPHPTPPPSFRGARGRSPRLRG
jgi:hypothetical protein